MPRPAHFFCVLLSAFLSLPAWAAPGDLDTSFGGGKGWVSTGFGGLGNGEGHDILQQADGKLVVAGSGWNGNDYDFALARYNTDGSLDATFNGTGKVATPIGTGDDEAFSVIRQTDGKLVTAGYSHNNDTYNFDFALVRYNSDGSLDTSFNGTGKVTADIFGSDDSASSVIQQVDGKLVVTGSGKIGFYSNIVLLRYNSDGTLDATFDGDGMIITAIGSESRGDSVIQQADGKLVVAGLSRISGGNRFVLARYNADGSFDTSFDGDGNVTTTFCANGGAALSLIQQTDGKLVAAGYCSSGGTKFALARYNVNGSLDTSFNSTGKVVSVWAGIARSIIQQADGKLVAAGYSTGSEGNYNIALSRYNTDGSLDNTFDDDGLLSVTINAETEQQAFSVIQQINGKLVVAGSNNGSLVLLRYGTDGLSDAGFDDDGMVLDSMLSFSEDIGSSVIQQADGKLVVAGSSNSNSGGDYDFALARYGRDGVLDPTFNGKGRVTTDIGGGLDRGSSVIQQADGKLVMAGFSNNGSNFDFALVRYNTDGSLDTTFNGTGKATTGIGGSHDLGSSVIQQADGKLVVAGYSHNGSNFDFALVRYCVDGSLDTTFNGTGKVTTVINGGRNDYGFSVIQQADGKLVAAGAVDNDYGSFFDFVLVRYNSDGTLDTSFNGNGKVITWIGDNNDQINSVIQQADGKLVAAGYSYNSNTFDFALARYNSDGMLDTSFNGSGIVTLDIGGGDNYASAVIQQADGKLVVTGYGYNSGNGNDIALARYNGDGILDTSFNGSGKVIQAIGSGHDYASAAIQQADGKLVMAGYASGMPTGQEFFVTRFESGQLDTDGDGWVNGLDTDNDGDGIENQFDLDDDNDGASDYIDAEPLNPSNNSEIVLPLDGGFRGSSVRESVSH